MEKITLAPQIIEAAIDLLKNNDVIHEAVEIPLSGNSNLKMALSPNSDDLIPLHVINYHSTTYY